MKDTLAALLVSAQETTYRELKRVLNEQGVYVRVAHSCAQVQEFLTESVLPIVIFSDTILPDGRWVDVLNMGSAVQPPIPVIVVSRIVNNDLYISALESGAADFVVPPFYRQDIAHVLCCAVQKAAEMSEQPVRTLTAA